MNSRSLAPAKNNTGKDACTTRQTVVSRVGSEIFKLQHRQECLCYTLERKRQAGRELVVLSVGGESVENRVHPTRIPDFGDQADSYRVD